MREEGTLRFERKLPLTSVPVDPLIDDRHEAAYSVAGGIGRVTSSFRIVLFVAGLCLFPLSAMGGDSPNVVLFLVDDMGWTDWAQAGGAEGSSFYETPNMDRLAREGVTFVNAYSSASVCSPTRNALLTGKNPARTRVTNWLPGRSYPSVLSDPAWTEGLLRSEVTLAEALRAGGYATGFIGKWHLGNLWTASENPLAHGFDSNVGGNFRGRPDSIREYFADAEGSFGLPNLRAGSSVPGDYLTDRLTDFAVEFIRDKTANEEEFFLFMSHYGVHTPIQAPEHLIAKYRAKSPSGDHSNATYAAMLETVDISLGRITDELARAGVRDDTIVIFASDNGGSLIATSNAPLRGGKGLLYEGGIRTPLVVSWTGNRRFVRGSENKAVVVSHDIYPTLLEMTGVPGDPLHNVSFDGESFESALESRRPDCGATFWHYPHISPQSVSSAGGRYVSAVRMGDWKLLYFYESRSWELYNLEADIGETTDLVEKRPDVANALGHVLVDRLVDTEAQLPIDVLTGQPVALPSPVPEGDTSPQCCGRTYPLVHLPRCLERPTPRKN